MDKTKQDVCERERAIAAVRDAHDRAFIRYLKHEDQDGRHEQSMDAVTPGESRCMGEA